MARTPVDLFVFGNRTGPRRPRVGTDIHPDGAGMIPAGAPPRPEGASTFADPAQAGLSGHYHIIPAGTELPEGLDVIADGRDVLQDSDMPETHHTIYATTDMPADEFIGQFLSLPWKYAGRL